MNKPMHSSLHTKEHIRVVVFTSNGFALGLIDYLRSQNMLAGVVVPDPSQLSFAGEVSALAAYLQQANIPYQMCCKEKLPLIVKQLDAWQVSVGIVANYSHILPADLLSYFPLGIYNFHASALPKYPGPMPVYWQVRNNEKSTALTLHRVEVDVDGGDIVMQGDIDIHELDTMQSLTNRMSHKAVEMIAEVVALLKATGEPLVGSSQACLNILEEPSLRGEFYARRPQPADCIIDYDTMNAQQISALCRAGSNSSYMPVIYASGVPIQIVQASPIDMATHGTRLGTIIYIGEQEGLVICVKDGALRLDVLASADGVFSGFAFAERFQLDAGMWLASLNLPFK